MYGNYVFSPEQYVENSRLIQCSTCCYMALDTCTLYFESVDCEGRNCKTVACAKQYLAYMNRKSFFWRESERAQTSHGSKGRKHTVALYTGGHVCVKKERIAHADPS